MPENRLDGRVPGKLLRSMAIASTAMSAATAGAYWRLRHQNPYAPALERLALRLPSNHDALAGMTIGFVTDVHAGPFVDAATIRTACELLARESPELILFGGDYISESPRFLDYSIPVLGQLAAAAPLGAFAVLGNHDIFVSSQKVTAALENVGITVLRNEARPIARNGGTLWVVGIDDSLHGSPDLDRAFAPTTADEPILALWHEPQFAEKTSAYGAFAQLSGHSHGGQVRIPGIRPVWLPRHGRRHIVGLNDANGMPVYTSRGVGVYRPPVRLNCPPEVTLITLTTSG